MKRLCQCAGNLLWFSLLLGWASLAFAQQVGPAACSVNTFALPVLTPFLSPIDCTFPAQAVQQPAFLNVYVFRQQTPTETWDEHLAAFIKFHPEFGPPANGASTVNCMNGTNSPCLQDLTSEAIDSLTRSIISSGYFQPMQNSYGISAPAFLGDANLDSNSGQIVSACGSGVGQTPTYFSLSSFIQCAFPLLGKVSTAPQLNLILAPDFDPPFPLAVNPTQAFNGPQLCTPPGSTDNAYHSTAFPTSPSLAGFLNCAEAAANPSPLGPLFAFENCVNAGAAAQCAEDAAAAGTVGPVVCGLIDAIIGAPGACETAVTAAVTTCVAEATNISVAQMALAGEINFTVIPTSPGCFGPKMVGLNQPRQILGGLASSATTIATAGGISSPLDMVSKSISHEMVETITDPAGAGWVDFSFAGTDVYSKGEVGDMCQPGGVGNKGVSKIPATIGIAAYMPFRFLHVSRYWSNADNQCMPSFDTTAPFNYTYNPTASLRAVGVTASVTGGALEVGSFWGPTGAVTQVNLDKLRVTNLARPQGPRNSAVAPPEELGNSIDSGGADPPVIVAVKSATQANVVMSVFTSAKDPLVLELWDGVTGQGCQTCASWPVPNSCTVAVQPVSASPTSGGGTTVVLNVETLAYGLSEPPLDGTPTYSAQATSGGSASVSGTPAVISDLGGGSCTAILPCTVTVDVAQGTTAFSVTSVDVIAAPPGTSFPTSLPVCTSNPILVSSIPSPPPQQSRPGKCSTGQPETQCGSGLVCLGKGETCEKYCTTSKPWCKALHACESITACEEASSNR